mmetsp:Transcript_6696/g.9056  ORF Transcript_6696/g.9056 Transcript_6696/m.9056 type:complete len:451 (-) Transcript_6696:109-1461(-)
MHQRRQPTQNFKLFFSELILSPDAVGLNSTSGGGGGGGDGFRRKSVGRRPSGVGAGVPSSSHALGASSGASPSPRATSNALPSSSAVNHIHHPFRHYIRPFSAQKTSPRRGSGVGVNLAPQGGLSPHSHTITVPSPIDRVRRRSRPLSPSTLNNLGNLRALALDTVPKPQTSLSQSQPQLHTSQSHSAPQSRRPSSSYGVKDPHAERPMSSSGRRPVSGQRPISGGRPISGQQPSLANSRRKAVSRSQPGFAVGTVPWIQPQFQAWHEEKKRRTNTFTKRVILNKREKAKSREDLDKYYEERAKTTGAPVTSSPKSPTIGYRKTPSGAIVTQAFPSRNNSAKVVFIDASTGSVLAEETQGATTPPAARLYIHNPRVPGALLAPKSRRVNDGHRISSIFKNTGFEDTRDYTPWNLGREKQSQVSSSDHVLPKLRRLELECRKLSKVDLAIS